MKKKMNGKLSLSKETLRTLDPRDMNGVQGGGTSETGWSNPTDTCVPGGSRFCSEVC